MRRLGLLVLFLSAILLGIPSTATAQNKSTIAIEHVTVIDGTGRPAIPDATVIIEGDRISRVSRTAIPIPAGAQRIDGRGKYLIPGMMDVHIHLHGGFAKPPDERAGIRALQSYLYCGVTTVLDVGNNPDFIFGLRAKERAGRDRFHALARRRRHRDLSRQPWVGSEYVYVGRLLAAGDSGAG